MPLPKPEAGLVIQYEYLWRDEYDAGAEIGIKQRPCAIIVAVKEESGVVSVVVAPVTHRQPTPPSDGVELPPRVKKHLGLDEQRSWVIITDLNVFTWPGFDLHPVPNAPPGTFDYGFLPPTLHKAIVAKILRAATRPIPRDHE